MGIRLACNVLGLAYSGYLPDVFRTSSGSLITSSTHHGNRTAMEIKEIMSRLQRRYQHIKFLAPPEETPCTAECVKVDTLLELQPSTSILIYV